jgi:hypothetical protein
MVTNRRRPFEQQDPAKGNFQAYKNLRSNYRDNPPAFNGRISTPGGAEERSVSLWATRSRKTGNIILSGPVTPDRKAQWDGLAPRPGEQPSADTVKYVVMKEGEEPFPVKPHHMILFTSPNNEVTEGKKAPPKMFGYFNPGGDHPVMVISAFEHADRNNNIMLLGPVEPYDPSKSYDQQMAREEPDHDLEGDPEVAAHLTPAKVKGRARSADDGPSR